MKKTINVAVVGTGFMGKTHSYAISNLRYFYNDLPFEACLHTVCSRTEENANKAKEQYGFKYGVMDYDEVVSNPEIDVVSICTPNYMHAEQILKAVNCGKHVYCEKPAVNTRDEAILVQNVLKDAKIVCGIVFNNRYFPATMRAKQLVEEGRIGNVVGFSGRYLHSSGLNRSSYGWRGDRKMSGGGALYDLGSHVVDLITHITGTRIRSVIGREHILNKEITDCDEHFSMIARLENGGLGTITVSRITIGTNDGLEIEIHGDKGAVKFSLMEPNKLYFFDGTKETSPYGGESGYTVIDCIGKYEYPGGVFPSSKAPVSWLRGHVHSMYSFLQSVYEGDTELKKGAKLLDSLNINCILEAAQLSNETGKEEEVRYIIF
ncbi:MAG: Gfo/Idh/MocA family oxidoreductase [Clostridiaceae bacterium]|nr:Gfo/Idh/MocA family oxidoreductase [Clostridiaceae bacterium]